MQLIETLRRTGGVQAIAQALGIRDEQVVTAAAGLLAAGASRGPVDPAGAPAPPDPAPHAAGLPVGLTPDDIRAVAAQAGLPPSTVARLLPLLERHLAPADATGAASPPSAPPDPVDMDSLLGGLFTRHGDLP